VVESEARTTSEYQIQHNISMNGKHNSSSVNSVFVVTGLKERILNWKYGTMKAYEFTFYILL
jgi:hypothetical protein